MNVGTETKQNLVPHFIKASTALLLTERMFENNLAERKEIKYFDIQYVQSDKSWYAWFYKEIDGYALISKAKVAK